MATNVARKLRIPRNVFHGTSCFSLVCMHLVATSKEIEDVASNTEYFMIADIPDKIENYQKSDVTLFG